MLTPRDLHGIFEQHAPIRPGRILVSTAGDRSGLTAAQLRREIDQRAQALRDAGAGPGAIVLMAGLQGAELLCWLLATWASDAVALPADPQMTAAEVEIVRRGTRAAVVITAESPGKVAGPAHVDLRAPRRDPGDGAAVIKLTSGTTGTPRGVLVTASQILADGTHLIAGMGIGPEDTNLAAIPLSHSYGLGSLVMPLVIQGSPIELVPVRAPAELAAALSADRPAIFPGVPALFEVLGRSDAPPIRPRGLRLCISAGAPLTSGTAAAFLERTGLPVRVFYGTSETGGISYDASPGGLAAIEQEGCVGTPLPGVEIALDKETARVRVRSDAVASCYLSDDHRPDPWAGYFSEGDYITSDTGRVDDAGRLCLSGRLTPFVNIAGRKVDPVEVQRCLADLRGVRAAAVVALADAARGESLGACVVADEGVRRHDVIAHLQGRLAAWKVPRQIIFLPELPVTARGKVDASALRRRLADLGDD